MIKHIIKLIWNQRKSNSWLLGELLLVTVCLWYIVDYLLVVLYTFSAPVGFDLDHTYKFEFNAREEGAEGYLTPGEHPAKAGEDLWEAMERIRRMPGVEEVALSRFGVPYNSMDNYQPLRRDTLSDAVSCRIQFVTPEYFDVYRIGSAISGNPEELKDGIGGMKVIITRDAAERLFPEKSVKDAVKQTVYTNNNSGTMTIGGISQEVRRSEFSKVGARIYINQSEAQVKTVSAEMLPWMEVSVRVKPEADRNFADTFMQEKSDQVEIGNLYLQNIIPLSNIREDALRDGKGEMKTRLSILLFLLVNIFLGIVGTFWFRTRQRQGEMGLRMALGATRGQLRMTVLGEGLVLLTLAFIPAIVICLNIAFANLIDSNLMDNSFLRFTGGMLVTFLLVAGMIIAGIWYPANEAAQLQPADALHYE